MTDRYTSFSQLAASESFESYRIERQIRGSQVALIAPHAGKIEFGTSEICRTLAGNDLTYYLFEGRKRDDNSALHITSSNFDEPNALEVARSAQVVVTIHGQSGSKQFINVGGLGSELGQITISVLIHAGYSASRQPNPALGGMDRNNICNRGKSGRGLQLEISRGLRDNLVSTKTEMNRFCTVIRAALQQFGL